MFPFSCTALLTVLALYFGGTRCKGAMPLNTESFQIQEDIVNKLAAESDESSFGLLHTLEAYERWADKEYEMSDVMEKKLELIDEEIMLITEYLEDYEESSGEALRHVREPKETPEERGKVIGSSAVLGHRMTSRYAGIIAHIRRFLTSDDYLENEIQIDKILEETQEFLYDETTKTQVRLAPGADDLFLSMASFFHVQHVYGYPPEQLIYGLVPTNGTSKEGRLDALQCTELGVFALFRKEYQIAVEWLEMAQQLLLSEEDEEEYNLPINVVNSLVQVAIQHHNRASDDPNTKRNSETFFNFYVSSITPFGKRISVGDVIYKNFNRKGKLGGSTAMSSVDAQFMALCREEGVQYPEIEKHLKCHYERGRHPWLYINPVKVEQLSKDPPVFQYYEMIDDNSIDFMRLLYGDKVTPSKSAGLEGETIPHWDTGAYKNIHPEEIPGQVLDLAEAATGLKIRSNREIFQYVEYMQGRHFHQHSDSLQKGAKPEDGLNPYDDWVATILYNLEVPATGGLTSFCQAGVSGRQVKGSALVWFNMRRNGTLRNDVYHGICPVLGGQKIILNRRIRYLDNWNSFKCSLNQFE